MKHVLSFLVGLARGAMTVNASAQAMKRLILLLASLWLLPAPSEGAWAEVSGQVATVNNTNDGTLTMPGAVGNGNTVFIWVSLASTAQTISITNTSLTWGTVTGFPVDSAGLGLRTYLFCATGDGVDTDFTVTTSGAATATSFAKEFSGGSCTLDGSIQSNEDSGDTSYALTNDLSVTNSDSLILSHIRSTNAANFNNDAAFTQFGSDNLHSAAQYRILSSSGTFDAPWTSDAAESTVIAAAAFASSGGGGGGRSSGRLTLLGVGESR